MKGLVLDAVSLWLDSEKLLTVTAAVGPGEALTVMGPSGAGKSTLLAFVAGFLPADFHAEGRILLDGEDVTSLPPERRGIGLLFQDPLLFPHLSVGGNLLLGVTRTVRRGEARRHEARRALAEVGLEDFYDRDPATLSGGQAARVALLRTLLARPRALILDEPFARLDTALRQQVRELVFAESRRRGLPVLLVTHDPADAAAAGGPVIELG